MGGGSGAPVSDGRLGSLPRTYQILFLPGECPVVGHVLWIRGVVTFLFDHVLVLGVVLPVLLPDMLAVA